MPQLSLIMNITIRIVPVARAAAWLAQGWRLFANAWGLWLLISLVWLVLLTAITYLPSVPLGNFDLPLGDLVSGAFEAIAIGGLYLAIRDQVQSGRRLRVSDLFRAFSGHPQIALWGVAYLLLALVASLVAFAVFGPAPVVIPDDPDSLAQDFAYSVQLLAVTGIISLVLTPLYWLGLPLSALKGVPIWDAMVLSWQASFVNPGAFLLYCLYVLVLFVVGLVTLVGFLIALPLLLLATYCAFSELLDSQPVN